MTFGEILRTLREERHWTQHDLQTTGLSRVLISHYEQGRRLPSFDHVQYLADALQVAVDVFFEGRGTAVAYETVLKAITHGTQAMQRCAWDEAETVWAQAWTLAMTYHFPQWAHEILWQRAETALARQAWSDVITYALPWLAHPEWGVPSDRPYRVLAVLGTAYRALGQLQTASLFYQLAQEYVSEHSDAGLRMAVNRGTCQWLLGYCEDACRLFAYARQEAALRGYAVVEAWATVGWTTVLLDGGETVPVPNALDHVEQLARLVSDATLNRALQQNRVVLARLMEDWDLMGELLQSLAHSYSEDPPPLSLVTEYLYRYAALGQWNAGEDLLRQARQSVGIGVEVQHFWNAAAVFYRGRDQTTRADKAHAFGQLRHLTWNESWQLFQDIQ